MPLMLVGEQPGDREDVDGKPFVGPAGRLLRSAITEAGIPIEECYLTNAVKHFKWSDRSGRRIHERPRPEEILACRDWLDGEIDAVHPALILALGVTAAEAVLGRRVTISRERGRVGSSRTGVPTAVAMHPSAILRMPDATARAEARAQLIADLRHAYAEARRRRSES